MTTSTDNNEPREGVQYEDWEQDIIADTSVEEGYGPNGVEKKYWYTIIDQTFQDGWVVSDATVNLKGMR